MATYTVSAGLNSVGPFTMTAGQVDTVTFTDNVRSADIVNTAGTVDVWVTLDGSTPAVPAAGSSTAAFRVPAGAVLEVELRKDSDSIKLVSSGTPTVSVQRSDT
jgi:hypothetical protein